MQFKTFSFIGFILLFLISTVVRASSTEASEGSGQTPGEQTKAGGDGADREWAKRTSKLNVLEAKVGELEKGIKSLIEQKKHTRILVDEKGNKIDILQKIADDHKKMLGVIADYNKEKSELKYRYPEEGALIDRRYMPLRERSIDQIEREIGLGGELTRTKKKIDKKYATFTKDEAPPPPPQAPRPEATYQEKPKPHEEGAAPKRLKLSQ